MQVKTFVRNGFSRRRQWYYLIVSWSVPWLFLLEKILLSTLYWRIFLFSLVHYMWTHPYWVGVTRISRLLLAWKLKLHFTCITDVSPAFCNCQVKQNPPPQKKQNKKNKTRKKTKFYLKRKSNLGKPLCINEALNI